MPTLANVKHFSKFPVNTGQAFQGTSMLKVNPAVLSKGNLDKVIKGSGKKI